MALAIFVSSEPIAHGENVPPSFPPCSPLCFPSPPPLRQVEDLQFRIEEQGVISGDQLETVEEATQQRVVELSRELEREREEFQKAREELQVCVSV